MAKLSDKYIAGFLDSDGGITLLWRPVDREDSNPEVRRLYIGLEFTQMTNQDEVISKIHEAIGGKMEVIQRKFGSVSRVRIFGDKAIAILTRIRKYLVLKRHYADSVLDMVKKPHHVNHAKKFLKEQRKVKSLPLPKHPCRKWAAGYLDGDGSFLIRNPKSRNSAQVALQVCSSDYDCEGIEILHKAFGGSISIKNGIIKWVLTLPPSKAKKAIGFFGKQMVVKKDQADFILGCAEMGHYRDGKNIKQAIKQLKAQPHRLNESGVNIKRMLSNIKDISYKDTYIGRKCGRPKRQSKQL